MLFNGGMKRFLIAAGLVVLTGCAGAEAPQLTPIAFDVSGSLLLRDVEPYSAEGKACTGDGGYSDIHAGTQVKITDDAGKVVALGALGPGAATKSDGYSLGGTDRCRFEFTVAGVPIGTGTIYGVEVSHRGVIQFAQEDAAALDLTLG